MRILLLIGLSLFLTTNTALAAGAPPIGIKNVTFNPVPWHATFLNGGFSLENQTNIVQYVQVTIQTGEIYVYTLNSGEISNCRNSLDAQKGPISIVCELAPHESLYGDLDFARMAEATGTYQVEMK